MIARLFVLIAAFALAHTVLAKEALRVGVSPDYPPLAYRDGGDLSGIDIAAAEVLGQQLGRKVKFVELPFTGLIPALQAGEIDIIMSGMTITTERARQVAFTKPYLDAGQMAIIRFSDAGRFAFKGALFRPGSKVGVQSSTTGEQFADASLKQAELTRFASLADGFALLKSGKIDFLVHDAATSWALATDKDKGDLMSLNHPLTDEQLGWAVRQDDKALLAAVEEQLAQMQSHGTLRAIIRRWIPVTIEVQDNARPTQSTRSTAVGNR